MCSISSKNPNSILFIWVKCMEPFTKLEQFKAIFCKLHQFCFPWQALCQAANMMPELTKKLIKADDFRHLAHIGEIAAVQQHVTHGHGVRHAMCLIMCIRQAHKPTASTQCVCNNIQEHYQASPMKSWYFLNSRCLWPCLIQTWKYWAFNRITARFIYLVPKARQLLKLN